MRLFCAFIALVASISARSKELKDNSFLLEEAYNQDPGVVQFIQSLQVSKKGDEDETQTYNFTNELPLSGRTHQISYVIPHVTEKKSGVTTSGIGDLTIAYRYQLVDSEVIAMTPKFSVLLPTGDVDRGFGNGSVGTQAAVAASVKINPEWETHWNAGLTFVPAAKGPLGTETEALVGTSFGVSAIYRPSETLQWMLEYVQTGTEKAGGDGTKSREDSVILSPGVRTAINFSGTQVVPGLAFPLGLGPAETERGVIAYLSVESALW